VNNFYEKGIYKTENNFGTLHCRYVFPALKRRAILDKSLRDSLIMMPHKN